MARDPTPRAVISSPSNPIHNSQSVPSASPYSNGDQRLGATSTVPDYGLAYNPAGSYEEVAGFSMDDGVEPASPTLVSEEHNYLQQAKSVELSQEDRQEGYDTNLLKLQPRGREHDIPASPTSPTRPESPRSDGDPFATPPPAFVSSGASFRSSSTGTPPHSPNTFHSFADPSRIAASGYATRARDSVQARKRASRGQSMVPSEKPLVAETKVQKWHKIRTIAIVAIVLIIVALAVGLGAGLGTRSHKSSSVAVSASGSASSTPSSTNTPIPDTSTLSMSSWTPTYTTDWATYTGEASSSTSSLASTQTDSLASSSIESGASNLVDTWASASSSVNSDYSESYSDYSDTYSASTDTGTSTVSSDPGSGGPGGGDGGGFKRGRRQHFRD